MPTIQEELEKNGSPRAEFFTDEDRRAMRIRIPIHPAFLREDRDDIENFAQNERSLSEVLSEVLKKKDLEKIKPIIELLETKDKITPKEAAAQCGKSPATVRRYLNLLLESGYVVAEGRTNNIVYRINKNA